MVKSSSQIKKSTKRGRPRIEGQLREPNGRISRSKKAAYQLTLERRAKRYNLTPEQAADPRAETYLGRLSLHGASKGLSNEQYDAALQFLKIRNDYKRSLLSPDAHYEQSSSTYTREDPQAYKDWVARAKKRYGQVLKAIEEAQFDNARENLYAALQYVLIEGQELPHLLGPTRMILNALHRHFYPLHKKASPTGYYNISLAGFTHNKEKDFQKEPSMFIKKRSKNIAAIGQNKSICY